MRANAVLARLIFVGCFVGLIVPVAAQQASVPVTTTSDAATATANTGKLESSQPVPPLSPNVPVASQALAPAVAGEPAITRPTLIDVAKISAGDTAWMLSATALVLLMTIPGLA